MSNLIGYDIGRLLQGDYDYTVCVSRRFLWLRRRLLPWTLRYETRHMPPFPAGGLVVERFPLFQRIAKQPATGAVVHDYPHL